VIGSAKRRAKPVRAMGSRWSHGNALQRGGALVGRHSCHVFRLIVC
jgi:hypothetical protein